MNGYLLGVDLGTTAIKVALFDDSARLRARSVQEYPLITPAEDIVEQEADVYWQAFRRGLDSVLVDSRVPPADIRGLGISAQGETLIPVDGAGAPLRRAIVWMDNRARTECAWLTERFTNEEIHRVTGQVSMLPMWPAAKVLWLRRNEPEVFRKTQRFLLIEDWFVHRLTGRFAAEGSLLCSTTWWNLRTHEYWPEMLDALGIGEERLPEVVEPGQRIGTILPAAARELGLSTETVVTMGALDQACGAIGVGNLLPGILSESTGSNVAICAVVDRPTIDPNGRLPCFYFGLPDTYMMHAFSMTGGMVLRWFRDTFGGGDYERLALEAAAAPAGSAGLVMLPHLQGAGPPESNPRARGVIYGLGLHHRREHLVRAVLESIALMLRRMVEAAGDMGIPVTEIRSLGGGARSGLWCQIKADTLGVPVRTMRNTQDAACLGAAFLAGTAVGLWPSVREAAEAGVELDRLYTPRAEHRAVYEDLYGTYRALYDGLTGVFER